METEKAKTIKKELNEVKWLPFSLGAVALTSSSFADKSLMLSLIRTALILFMAWYIFYKVNKATKSLETIELNQS